MPDLDFYFNILLGQLPDSFYRGERYYRLQNLGGIYFFADPGHRSDRPGCKFLEFQTRGARLSDHRDPGDRCEGLVLTRTDYQPDNIIHHIVKIISFYLVYKAIIETGLQRPLSILMRNLKRSQEEQWQVSLKLAEQNEELEAFAHTVAHDLKNPISAILMAAVAASDPALDEREKKSFLADIKGTAVKMNSITDNLMMLARVRKSEIHLEALDMQEILNSVFVRLRPMIQEHQAEIHSQQDWPVAVGYAPWIEEVWANYLSNAIQYGGEPPCIQIGATTQPDGMLRFWIRDNGSGIPLEEQSKLFKPFSQIQTLKSIGHGLGLSIVRRIIERLDGQVGVESQPGQGSTFYFTLPAK